MSKGFFRCKSVTNLQDMAPGDEIQESDYATITENDKFLQFEYIAPEKREREKYIVTPGLYSITTKGNQLALIETEFTKESILDDMVNTTKVEEAVDTFFDNLDAYRECGIDVPKRNILLFGPPGTGKSTAITKIINKYLTNKKIAAVVWHTAAWEPQMVKEFLKTFKYEGVDFFFLIAEDLGGVEADEGAIFSDSSLLSLLDNTEKTFELPTCVISTTNFPERFLANIMNRPGRFDDKIEVPTISSDSRKKLLSFFSKKRVSDEDLELIGDNKFEAFSVAHIKEVWIRSRIRKKSISDVLKEMEKEIRHYQKAFSNKGSMGL